MLNRTRRNLGWVVAGTVTFLVASYAGQPADAKPIPDALSASESEQIVETELAAMCTSTGTGRVRCGNA